MAAPAFYAKLSDSEKRYVMGAAIFFPLLIVVVVFGLFLQSIGEVETETQRYKSSLDFLATAAPVFLENRNSTQQSTSHKKLDDEVLRNNDIKLTSFVAGHAKEADITVSSYDEDELPFGSRDEEGPIIIEQQLRVEIREADMAKLIKLMDLIEQSTEPVFIQRLDIRKRGREPGEVRAILTVSTFVKREKST